MLPQSLVHGTLWTSDEKERFMKAVARRGRGNCAAVARDVETKTEQQCAAYMDLLESGKAEVEKVIPVDISEFPTAREIPDCFLEWEDKEAAKSLAKEKKQVQRQGYLSKTICFRKRKHHRKSETGEDEERTAVRPVQAREVFFVSKALDVMECGFGQIPSAMLDSAVEEMYQALLDWLLPVLNNATHIAKQQRRSVRVDKKKHPKYLMKLEEVNTAMDMRSHPTTYSPYDQETELEMRDLIDEVFSAGRDEAESLRKNRLAAKRKLESGKIEPAKRKSEFRKIEPAERKSESRKIEPAKRQRPLRVKVNAHGSFERVVEVGGDAEALRGSPATERRADSDDESDESDDSLFMEDDPTNRPRSKRIADAHDATRTDDSDPEANRTNDTDSEFAESSSSSSPSSSERVAAMRPRSKRIPNAHERPGSPRSPISDAERSLSPTPRPRESPKKRTSFLESDADFLRILHEEFHAESIEMEKDRVYLKTRGKDKERLLRKWLANTAVRRRCPFDDACALDETMQEVPEEQVDDGTTSWWDALDDDDRLGSEGSISRQATPRDDSCSDGDRSSPSK